MLDLSEILNDKDSDSEIKEIANTEAYTAEMLLGQIGGFVGRI